MNEIREVGREGRDFDSNWVQRDEYVVREKRENIKCKIGCKDIVNDLSERKTQGIG